VRLFNEAVTLDPGFSRAWSNLAVAYLNLPDYDRSYDPEKEIELALKTAEKALEISPHSTEALIIKANYDHKHCNFVKAARLYETAIAYNPEDPTAHHWYANLLAVAGRTTLALEQIQTSRKIDPLIAVLPLIEADLYINLGDYARAEALHREAAALGIYGGSLYQLGKIYLQTGEIEKGKALIEKGWFGEDPAEVATRQLFLQAVDDPEKQQAFEQHIGKAGDSYSYTTASNVTFLTLLGSDYLFKFQSDAKCPVLDVSIWDETFRAQRNTPEFFEMMKRAGAVAYWREFGWPDDCTSLDQELAECP